MHLDCEALLFTFFMFKVDVSLRLIFSFYPALIFFDCLLTEDFSKFIRYYRACIMLLMQFFSQGE